MSGGNTAAMRAPESLLQLFLMMGKGFIKGIPTLLKKSIVKLAIIFTVIVVLNTYLLVVKNEGFAPTMGNKWLDITALQGNVGWATTFWTFAMFFATTVFARIKEDGFSKFISDLTGVPAFFSEKKKQSGKNGTVVLLFAIMGVLLVTTIVPGKRALLLYTLIAFLSFSKKEESFLMVFFTLLISDVKKLLDLKKKSQQSSIYMMTFSVWVAFLIAYIVKTNLYIIIIAVVLGGLGFYLKTQSTTAKTMIFVFMLAGANVVYFRLTGRILADDGGWQEAGGTLGGWIQSQGAGTAVGMGIPPAGGGLLGAAAGAIYTSFNPSDFIPSPDVLSDMFDDYMEFADDFMTGVGEDLSDGYDTAVQMGEEAIEFADDFMTGVGEDLSDGYDAAVQMGEDVVDFTGDFLDNVYEDLTSGDYKPIGDEVISDDWSYSNVKDYISGIGNMIGYSDKTGKIAQALTAIVDKTSDFSGFMKDMIKNSDEYVKIAADYMGDPKSKIKYIKEAFKNMKLNKVTQGLDKLGNFMNFVGMGFDAYDNISAGDSIFSGITKSVTANSVAISLANKAGSATVAGWELANQVLFGGSKASSICSPVTTVKGGINAIYDYFSGVDETTFMERLNGGLDRNGKKIDYTYGENVKNLYYAADFAEDFVSDPGQFYETVGDMTQAGGEGWEGMHKSVDDIFRLPDDVRANTQDLYSSKVLETVWENPLDSTRKVATDAAHLVTDTAVKVGEGWAYIGEAAGEGSVWAEQKLSSGWNYAKSFFK